MKRIVIRREDFFTILELVGYFQLLSHGPIWITGVFKDRQIKQLEEAKIPFHQETIKI